MIKQFLALLVVITIFFCGVGLFQGCNHLGIKIKEEFCAKVPDGETSVICLLSDFIGESPESISTTLKVGNLALIEQAYTAQQAYDFVQNLKKKAIEFRDIGDITWDTFANYLMTKYKLLPVKVQMAFVLAKDYIEVDEPFVFEVPMSRYDWDEGIINHLDKQLEIISLFMKSL